METLAFGYGLVEAPRVDDAGNLYLTDVLDGGVFRLERDGSVTTADNTEQPDRRGTIFRSRAPVAGLVAPPATI